MKINIGKYNKKGDQKVSIKLDSWDTFSADHTLARIIHPMLVAYKAAVEGKGTPCCSFDEDVPVHLKSTIGIIDGGGDAEEKLQIEQWDWILCEMIWAFSEHVSEEGDSIFFDHPENNTKEYHPDDYKKIKIDHKGLEAYHDRKQKGFQLFGKYFNGLWR